jgi:acyl carrier protein
VCFAIPCGSQFADDADVATRVVISTSSGKKEAGVETISNLIHAYILQEFLPGEDPADLTDRTPLITGAILDSISTLKLVTFLEKHFGIMVEAHEAAVEHLDTIGQIAALVARKKSAA